MKQEELVTNTLTAKDSLAENSTGPDSTTSTVSIQDEVPRELARGQFVAFQTPIEEIHEVMVADLGENTMSVMDLEKIRVPSGGGGAWTVPDVAGEQIMKELSGIILMWREVRTFWKLPLEQSDGAMPPDCYSIGARKGVGDPGGDCQSCRYAQFGSDPKGEGQACKLSRQLLFLREENLLPDIVSLPAGSIKAARQYFQRLAAKGLACYGLLTKIGLEKARNAQGIEYSRATFTAGDALTREQARHAGEYAAMLKSFIEAEHPAAITKPPRPPEGEAV
jgi:hypothetical protein